MGSLIVHFLVPVLKVSPGACRMNPPLWMQGKPPEKDFGLYC